MDPKVYFLSIAGLKFRIWSDHVLRDSENFTPFFTDSTTFDCENTILGVDTINTPKGIRLCEDLDSKILRTDDSEIMRVFHSFGMDETYAVTRMLQPGKSTNTVYQKKFSERVQTMNQCFHLINWEHMMLSHDRLILHASCIETAYGGILFSGRSGIGKSTQADLWIRHRNATLINGDRTILYKKEYWYGYGSPFAGSSRCYKNAKAALRAIVMLEQGNENSIRRLSTREAFRKIYEGVTVFLWDEGAMEQLLTLVTQLIAEVPVYCMSCLPDETAVCELENLLKGEGNHESE